MYIFAIREEWDVYLSHKAYATLEEAFHAIRVTIVDNYDDERREAYDALRLVSADAGIWLVEFDSDSDFGMESVLGSIRKLEA